MKVKCILIYSIITALSFFYLLHQVSAQNDDMDRILIQLEAEINRLSDFLSEQELEPLNEILESLKKQKTETAAAEDNEIENSEAEIKSAEDKLVEAGEQARKLSESERVSRISLEPEKMELQFWDKAQQSWGSDLLSIKQGCEIYTKSKHFDYKTKSEGRLQAGYSWSLIDESLKAWSSSSGRFPHWIIFDIGKEVTLGRFGFINHYTNHQSDKGANFTKDLEVWTSRDRIDFISIGRVTLKSGKRGSDSWSQNHRIQAFNFAPIRARFVKVIFLSNYYQYSMYKKSPILFDRLGISLAEVMAFER
jgi:hypothetical protein